MKIHSAVVSRVVPVGFADLAQAADKLPGSEITAGRSRLKIHGRAGSGFVGSICLAGSLRDAFPLLPAVKVELVLSPWSANRSEIALHPMANLGPLDSFRAKRFFESADAIVGAVVDRLYEELPVEVPAPAELAA